MKEDIGTLWRLKSHNLSGPIIVVTEIGYCAFIENASNPWSYEKGVLIKEFNYFGKLTLLERLVYGIEIE